MSGILKLITVQQGRRKATLFSPKSKTIADIAKNPPEGIQFKRGVVVRMNGKVVSGKDLRTPIPNDAVIRLE